MSSVTTFRVRRFIVVNTGITMKRIPKVAWRGLSLRPCSENRLIGEVTAIGIRPDSEEVVAVSKLLREPQPNPAVRKLQKISKGIP